MDKPDSTAYDVIAVDPPWAYGAKTNRPNRTAESQYETIGNSGKEVNRKTGAGIENIATAAPVGEWAKSNAHLYLWTTNPKLPFAFALMAMWGFTYKTMLTWVKTTKAGEPIKNGMGFFFRGGTEHVLFGVRGNLPIPPELRQPNEFESPDPGWAFDSQRGLHSEKPAKFYSLVEAASPGLNRLDVFARRQRSGWSVFGNEISSAAQDILL